MKSILRVFVTLNFLVFSSVCSAQEWSCEELTYLADELDMIAEAFDQAGTIVEGDAIDRALGEVVDAIIVIADVENDSSLNRSVDNLLDAYNNMRGESFAMALDSVILNLDRLYRRDC